MKKLRLIFLLASSLFITAPAFAQDASMREAMTLMKKTEVTKLLDQMFPALFAQVKQLLVTSNPGQEREIDAVLNELIIPEFRASLPQLETSLAAVYAQQFSLEELKGLNQFYDTPLGRKVIATQAPIAQQLQAISAAWGQEIARRSFEKNAEAMRRRGLKL